MISKFLKPCTNQSVRLFSSKALSNLKYGPTAPLKPYTLPQSSPNERSMNYPLPFNAPEL